MNLNNSSIVDWDARDFETVEHARAVIQSLHKHLSWQLEDQIPVEFIEHLFDDENLDPACQSVMNMMSRLESAEAQMADFLQWFIDNKVTHGDK